MKLTLALVFAAGLLCGQQSLQIVTDSLPDATVGTTYLQQLATTGGICQEPGTTSITIDSGALPAGFIVTAPGTKQWAISGFPTVSGVFNFTVHITFDHTRASPLVQACTDNAVKAFTLTVTAGQPQVSLSVDRSQVTTTARINQLPPADEKVQLISSGGAATSFTTLASTTSGGNWLSVSPASGFSPATLSLSFSTSGLTVGVYTGKVTITPANGAPLNVAVTLSVIVDTSIVLAVSPSSLAFSSATGAPAPAAQTLKVSVTGANVIFQADLNTPANGKWLSITPSAALTPASLTVSVDPKTLTAGTYTGTITLHVSGVTANAQVIPVTYTIQAPNLPLISPNGVVNAGNLAGAIAPGTWVTIFGANLSATNRPWRDTDFVGGKLPTALDGVSVTINGKAAAVSFVSPTQVNVLAPDDITTGLVAVQVKTSIGVTDSAFVLLQTAAPAFFQFRGGAAVYVAGTHADGSYLAGAAVVQQGIPGTPAKPGETIVLYGTGFGLTLPAISATALVPAPLPLANPQDLRIRIGGLDAAIAFAGLISPGLYQFNVVVPQLADGDQPVVAELRGLLSSSSLLLAIQH